MTPRPLWIRVVSGFLVCAILLWASGIAPQAYNLIESNGTPAVRSSTLNFSDTASVTWSCSTSAGVTTCQSTATGGAGGYTTIQANGSPLPQEPVLNLIDGTNTTVSCADNPGNTSTDCEIDASGGGGGGFIQPLTAPVAADFTQLNYNTGSGVVTTQVNNSSPVTSVTLLQHDPNNTQNIVAMAKNKIASTFTVTIAASIPPTGVGSTQGLAGLWLSDGGSPPNSLFFSFQALFGLRGPVFSDFTTFVGDVFGGTSPVTSPGGPLFWFRIKETASVRNFYVSSDGITFAQIFSESVGSHFTTAQYGWAVECRQASSGSPDNMITVYSFTETNP